MKIKTGNNGGEGKKKLTCKGISEMEKVFFSMIKKSKREET